MAGSQKPKKKKISPRTTVFRDNCGKPFPMQSCGSLNELYEHAEKIEKQFIKFGARLEKLTGGKFKLGATKEFDTAREKIDRDCHGNATLISDIVRAKIKVSSPEAIETLLEMLDPEKKEEDPLFKEFKGYCAQLNNHFAAPKLETGYRAINAKIAFPLFGKDGKEIEGEYLVELQVVHKALDEAVYDKTHKHMRLAQDILSQYNNVQIPNGPAIRADAHFAVCRKHNGVAAREAGLDRLLVNPSDALSFEEENEADAKIKQHNLD